MERKLIESNEKIKSLQNELKKSQKLTKELPRKDRVRIKQNFNKDFPMSKIFPIIGSFQ